MKKLVVCIMFLFIIATVAFIYAQEKGKTSGWSYCPYCGKYLGPQTEYGRGQGLSGARGMMDSGIGPVDKKSWYDYEKGHMMMKQSKACQKFLDETVELRKELNNKRFAYHEAIRDPESTTDEVTKLENDLKELQDTISEKRPLECIW
jgi:hypothetical protein